MKIFHHLNDFHTRKNSIVTTGTFDGVHLGHQKIISKLVSEAQKDNLQSVIITFWPHPRKVVAQNLNPIKILSTIDEKSELFEKLGVQNMLILPFTREFSQLSSEQFVEDFLIKGLAAKKLVIGYDHRFGKDREGGIDYLRNRRNRFNLEVEEITRQEVYHLTVSSTKIREAIEIGQMNLAQEMLGRYYSFQGIVIKGRQMGRTIGFPTANINLDDSGKLLPKNGVYAVKVYLRKTSYNGVMNIGTRPTVDGQMQTQEIYIFEFGDDIYGEFLKAEIVAFIRDEQKFDGIEALKNQIAQDVLLAKKLLFEK